MVFLKGVTCCVREKSYRGSVLTAVLQELMASSMRGIVPVRGVLLLCLGLLGWLCYPLVLLVQPLSKGLPFSLPSLHLPGHLLARPLDPGRELLQLTDGVDEFSIRVGSGGVICSAVMGTVLLLCLLVLCREQLE